MLRQDRATADARTRERGLIDIVARVKRSRRDHTGARQSRGAGLNDRGGCDAASGGGSDHDAGNCSDAGHGRVEKDDDDECVRRLARALSAPIADVRRAWATTTV